LSFQKGLFKALEGVDNLPKGMDDKEKEDFMEQTHNVIQLCLCDGFLKEVIEETTTTRL